MLKVNLKTVKAVFLLVMFLGLILFSCHREPKGPCPPGIVLIADVGIKDIVVSPLEEGLSLRALRVNSYDYDYKRRYTTIDNAEMISYLVDSSQLRVKESYPLYPSIFTNGFDSFNFPTIYPVSGTSDAFIFSAEFFTGETTAAETFYFLNENGKFKKVKGGVFNSAFRIVGGYYFSIVSLLYWAPLLRYPNLVDQEKSSDVRISADRLPGFFEAYPYDSIYHPRIFMRDKELDLSKLFIVEGGEIIGDTNLIYFQGSDSFNNPYAPGNISSYLFVGNIEVNGYSMDITDVRYIQFKDPATFTTIIGVEYFEDMGLVVYAREFPKNITGEQGKEITEIKDKVMILDPQNLTVIREKKILYDKTNLSETASQFSLLASPSEKPYHFVAFDRKNKRIVSVLGNKVIIFDLISSKIDTVDLPSPWICDKNNTGVWIDGNGHIWVIARDVNSGKKGKMVVVKQGVLALIPIKFRYGVLNIDESNGKYSVKVIGELE